jgi:dienelactone hydrolase
MKTKRRDFLKLTGLTGAGLLSTALIPGYAAVENEDERIIQSFQQRPLNRFPRMMQEYFVHKVRNVEEAGEKRRSRLRSKRDAEAYIQDVRARLFECFGPWPDKTPLNSRVVGILNRKGYTIEKIIFESRPGFHVPANLYIPKNQKFPLPGIIGTVGHARTSKAYKEEQSFAQSLVNKGYIVLLFDPIGQGERIQSISSDLKPRHGIGTGEHNYTGRQMLLTGESLSTWFAWDGIRALDYLLTRPEVDPKHVGVTGNSGGGMQTSYLCAIESRFTMAAPCCWVTTFRRNIENEEPADIEQCVPGVLASGLDQADFIACIAPKPVLILSQEKDFFDTRGSSEAVTRLKKLYKLLGAEENIKFYVGPDYHGYSKENREEMYAFFNNLTGISFNNKESAVTLEDERTLWCTPNGQIGEFKANTVFSLNRSLSRLQKDRRRNIYGYTLREAVKAALKLPPIEGVADYRILRPAGYRAKRKFYATYAVETELGIFALMYYLSNAEHYSQVPAEFKRAILYISHLSADAELQEEPLLEELIKSEPNSAIFACDVRGIGESKPNTCSKDFLDPYGSDYFYAVHSIMFDYPYIGQKTYDVIRVVDLLTAVGYNEIHLAGKGWGALPATYAALLSENVSQITVKNALTSYNDIIESEDYDWPLSALLPGVLKSFDLPDCYRELSSKKLRQIEPCNAFGVGKK